jgi:hypothetical protein
MKAELTPVNLMDDLDAVSAASVAVRFSEIPIPRSSDSMKSVSLVRNRFILDSSETKPMKTNKLILMCGALAGVVIATPSTGYAESQPPAPSANSAITWTAGGKQSKQVDVLFVQNAKNVTINEDKLVL